MPTNPTTPPNDPEARWPAIIALLAVGGLYMALPDSLAVGPRWLQLVLVILLLIPTIITHRLGMHHLNHILGHILAAVTTLFMLWSLTLLVLALPAHKEEPLAILRSAVALWLTNILVFAYWYWRLDAGGPYRRDARPGHPTGAFLFPQMTLRPAEDHTPHPVHAAAPRPWSPAFIDYLFLAFNTATAFSPTDAPVLSRWAKVLTMLESTISLATIVILAARAINIM